MDCIFCKIATGEIPCKKVYEDEAVLAFQDITPEAPIHILAIPKKHVANIVEATDNQEIIIALHKAVAKIAQQQNLLTDGFRLVANTGSDGGQTVNHLHFHILGGRKMNWPPG